MLNRNGQVNLKSYHRQAFLRYLRTGQRADMRELAHRLERKFNPYHDPQNGQFTFGPGRGRTGSSPAVNPPVGKPAVTLAQYKPNPRARMGGNRGPALKDPMTLERTFPGLRNAPEGSIIALADHALDITGPASRLTAELADAEVKSLIQQIRKVDPDFQFDSVGTPTTLDGQINQVKTLRMHRAAKLYNVKGDVKPLQVEVLRRMQASTDQAYEDGQALFEAGRLKPRLSRNEAVGNFIDRAVRKDMKKLLAQYWDRTGSRKASQDSRPRIQYLRNGPNIPHSGCTRWQDGV